MVANVDEDLELRHEGSVLAVRGSFYKFRTKTDTDRCGHCRRMMDTLSCAIFTPSGAQLQLTNGATDKCKLCFLIRKQGFTLSKP